MPRKQEGRPAELSGASQSRFLAGNDREGTALRPTRQNPTQVASGASLRIAIFRNLDPASPPGQRYLAHAFHQNGRSEAGDWDGRGASKLLARPLGEG
jgi:hypothetical protein